MGVSGGIVVLRSPTRAKILSRQNLGGCRLVRTLFVIKRQKDHKHHDIDKDQSIRDIQELQDIHILSLSRNKKYFSKFPVRFTLLS